MQLPETSTEPTERRIRVRLGSTVVAESLRAQLLIQYGPDGLPTYYLPLAVGAAWTHPRPTGDLAALADHVTFSWRQLDWFEEDEQALVHARDPHKRVDTLRSSRQVEVRVEGELVARSVRPLLLFENPLPIRFYLPFEDVRTELFVASDLVTMCPYKGRARYWSVQVGKTLVPDLAWSYPDPIPENPKIKDLVCFFNERVELTVDGVLQERVHTPWDEPPATTIDGVLGSIE